MPTAKPTPKALAKKKPNANVKLKKAAKPDFTAVFNALRQMLEAFHGDLAVQTDKPGNFHTEIPSILHRGKPLYFAGIRTGKNYVSFHLLPMYNSQELHKGMSAALKKRMQGKACFNFTVVDQECFAELGRLTAAGLKIFRSQKFRLSIQKMQ